MVVETNAPLLTREEEIAAVFKSNIRGDWETVEEIVKVTVSDLDESAEVVRDIVCNLLGIKPTETTRHFYPSEIDR